MTEAKLLLNYDAKTGNYEFKFGDEYFKGENKSLSSCLSLITKWYMNLRGDKK